MKKTLLIGFFLLVLGFGFWKVCTLPEILQENPTSSSCVCALETPEQEDLTFEELLLENQAYREMLDECRGDMATMESLLPLCKQVNQSKSWPVSACPSGQCHDEWPVTIGPGFLEYPPGVNKHQDMMVRGLLMQIHQAYPLPANAGNSREDRPENTSFVPPYIMF